MNEAELVGDKLEPEVESEDVKLDGVKQELYGGIVEELDRVELDGDNLEKTGDQSELSCDKVRYRSAALAVTTRKSRTSGNRQDLIIKDRYFKVLKIPDKDSKVLIVMVPRKWKKLNKSTIKSTEKREYTTPP